MPAVSVAEEPQPDAVTRRATEKAALRGLLTRDQQAALTPQTMLAKIRPAIKKGRPFDGKQASDNPAYVAHVCHENVRLAVAAIRERSELLRTMEADGAIKIVGAYYDLRSGEVTLLPPIGTSSSNRVGERPVVPVRIAPRSAPRSAP